MIEVNTKSKCCGCYACFNICPYNAIEMQKDEKGFKYPIVNKNKCKKCGLCVKSCPIINKKQILNTPKAYACFNKDENIRQNSSSGGIFTLIAEKIIDNDGIVFGAQFDDQFNVIHSYVDKKEELYKFRGSKYVQSDIGETYKKAQEFLENNKPVLFTGTPCQIEGLYSFLKKEYDKLYTQDLICHGVPSPKVWNKYKEILEKNNNSKIKNFNFRDKKNGWANYSLKYEFENKTIYNESKINSRYMQLFLKDLSLRDSCYECVFKSKNRKSDITLADFWGIKRVEQDMYDNKGTSLVIINSEKGIELFETIKKHIKYKETNFEKAIGYNSSMTKSPQIPEKREDFFKELDVIEFNKLVKRYVPKEKLYKKIIHITKRILKKLLKKT